MIIHSYTIKYSERLGINSHIHSFSFLFGYIVDLKLPEEATGLSGGGAGPVEGEGDNGKGAGLPGYGGSVSVHTLIYGGSSKGGKRGRG